MAGPVERVDRYLPAEAEMRGRGVDRHVCGLGDDREVARFLDLDHEHAGADRVGHTVRDEPHVTWRGGSDVHGVEQVRRPLVGNQVDQVLPSDVTPEADANDGSLGIAGLACCHHDPRLGLAEPRTQPAARERAAGMGVDRESHGSVEELDEQPCGRARGRDELLAGDRPRVGVQQVDDAMRVAVDLGDAQAFAGDR